MKGKGFALFVLGLMIGFVMSAIVVSTIYFSDNHTGPEFRIVKRKWGGYVVQTYQHYPGWHDFKGSIGGKDMTLDEAKKFKNYMEAPQEIEVKEKGE